jgi:hypothetical protein
VRRNICNGRLVPILFSRFPASTDSLRAGVREPVVRAAVAEARTRATTNLRHHPRNMVAFEPPECDGDDADITVGLCRGIQGDGLCRGHREGTWLVHTRCLCECVTHVLCLHSQVLMSIC